MACPSKQSNIYQFWQERDSAAGTRPHDTPTSFPSKWASTSLFLLYKAWRATGLLKHWRWSWLDIIDVIDIIDIFLSVFVSSSSSPNSQASICLRFCNVFERICTLSGAQECMPSQMTCPSKQSNIYQFWQKWDSAAGTRPHDPATSFSRRWGSTSLFRV